MAAGHRLIGLSTSSSAYTVPALHPVGDQCAHPDLAAGGDQLHPCPALNATFSASSGETSRRCQNFFSNTAGPIRQVALMEVLQQPPIVVLV